MTKLIGGIQMSLPIILGAGVCKQPRQLIRYLQPDLPLGARIAGSFTVPYREGNSGVVQWPNDFGEFLEQGFGLNSFGMPNLGIAESTETLASLPDAGLPILASLAPFSIEECVELMRRSNKEPTITGLEINWGCGNTGKIPDAYSYENAHATLKALEELARNGELPKPLWVKLSPYLTVVERDALAKQHRNIDFSEVPTVTDGFAEAMVELIARYPFVKAVVFGNTLANCRVLDTTGKPVTTPFGGKAGLSGPILKGIAIGLIERCLKVLPPWEELHFIGCGGVLAGDDVIDYMEAGAKAVQCTSGPAWYIDGPRFFTNLIQSESLLEYLTRQGWVSNDD